MGRAAAGEHGLYLSGGVKSAVWLVLVAGLTWLAGLLLEKQNARPAPDKAAKTAVRSAKKRICAACLVLCFGLLYLMKYWNFTASAVPSALGDKLPRWDFVVPLGLSYFIFQSVGYVIDVYRGKAVRAEKPAEIRPVCFVLPADGAGSHQPVRPACPAAFIAAQP